MRGINHFNGKIRDNGMVKQDVHGYNMYVFCNGSILYSSLSLSSYDTYICDRRVYPYRNSTMDSAIWN